MVDVGCKSRVGIEGAAVQDAKLESRPTLTCSCKYFVVHLLYEKIHTVNTRFLLYCTTVCPRVHFKAGRSLPDVYIDDSNVSREENEGFTTPPPSPLS